MSRSSTSKLTTHSKLSAVRTTLFRLQLHDESFFQCAWGHLVPRPYQEGLLNAQGNYNAIHLHTERRKCRLKTSWGFIYPNDWRVPTATAWLKRFSVTGITSPIPGSKLLQLYLKYKYNLSSKLSLLPSIHRTPLCTSLIMSVFSTIPPMPADRKVLPSGLLPRVLTSFIKAKINKVTAQQNTLFDQRSYLRLPSWRECSRLFNTVCRESNSWQLDTPSIQLSDAIIPGRELYKILDIYLFLIIFVLLQSHPNGHQGILMCPHLLCSTRQYMILRLG